MLTFQENAINCEQTWPSSKEQTMKSQVPFISTQGISLLLVDDNPMFLHLLKELLERNSYMQIVGTAFTGEQAFAIARHKLPWVIIIDLEMQIFTNPHAISYLRSRSPASTIIALTLLEENLPSRSRDKFGVDAIIAKSRLFTDLTPVILQNMFLTLEVLPKMRSYRQPAEMFLNPGIA
jgi:DNA-binding NarL/FixJ family response regulator